MRVVLLLLLLILWPGPPSSSSLLLYPTYQIIPPKTWQTIYTDVQRCAGIDTPMIPWDSLQFMVVKTQRAFWVGQWAVAMRSGNYIYLAEPELQDSTLFAVRHELLHAASKVRGHPEAFEACQLQSSAYIP